MDDAIQFPAHEVSDLHLPIGRIFSVGLSHERIILVTNPSLSISSTQAREVDSVVINAQESGGSRLRKAVLDDELIQANFVNWTISPPLLPVGSKRLRTQSAGFQNARFDLLLLCAKVRPCIIGQHSLPILV
ncbi:hypothetical protein THIARS_60722 [Thiomonas delicata]|uniref:Uncharacterized protein n=1 Tax=Thiomonas delicata TaxID=364030 RepID=A0A238D479_THIDL|nr:hypothetical protein THIARS_60722 [Thiomonas delicata]